MKIIVMTCLLLASAATVGLQDPQPDPQPARTVQGVPERDPLEGLYRLQSRTVRGVPDLRAVRGYVSVTRRHMLLCLAAAGPDPDYPLLRAGVRTWEKSKHGVETVMKLGFYTDDDGDIHVEKPGTMQVRRIDLVRGMLRIWQDQESFLDFERIE